MRQTNYGGAEILVAGPAPPQVEPDITVVATDLTFRQAVSQLTGPQGVSTF
jgi:hypothetical protein